ncbi:MAG: hypothetical protein HXY34_02320 [Candidatus Thorarchaeota archaeon]|nr:hypothetical protein [Candidatus Thorarchaeota archaeon]
MEIASAIKTCEITKAAVVDTSGRKIGHISDLTFKFDGRLKLSQFILAGSRIEEFLERARLRPDRDPVFDASFIKRIDSKKVYLGTSVDEMKTTLDSDAIPQGEIRFSRFEKLDVVDKAGVKVGRPIDVHFDTDGTTSIIVGGPFLEEKLEAIGIKKDIDIIVPDVVIQSVSDCIKLSVSKEELATTMESALKDLVSEVRRARDSKATQRSIAKVHLFTQRPL